MPSVATAGQKALVIVESPTKAKTIRKFLGKGFTVEASMGHVRDLPSSAAERPEAIKGKSWADLAVDVENGFEPVYVVPTDKKKLVAELKKALKGCDVLYLATDEDREGEAIGWHLVELLKPKVPTHRLVFHEITETAIKKAIETPRELDEKLVQAQEARRVLDRLVGYVVSPMIWRLVARGLSAGRVQSVAVRLLVMRERERLAFISGSWWDLKAKLGKGNSNFDADLIQVGGAQVASGRDFDEKTGQIKVGRDVLRITEDEANALKARLAGKPFRVASLERKIQERKPYPPFTTSSLQIESNRKLGYGAKRTMNIAQRLYERGHITYMRTDSVNIAEEAIQGIRRMVDRRYGPELLSPKERRFSTKAKGAQEAHEAIRPAGTDMSTARELGLGDEEARLYDLIWKRTVSTQMANAKIALTTARLAVADEEKNQEVLFRASGRQVVFPGFFRAYVEGSDDPEAVLDDKDQPLPGFEEGDDLTCSNIDVLGHETRPPSRFTEATLVKMLETQGIGRPSTYASIIDTIQRRGYVRAERKQLLPTFTAMVVTGLLEKSLGRVVDVEFTASMENWLDEIAVGGDPTSYLQSFYSEDLIAGLETGKQFSPRDICTLKDDKFGPHRVRLGRYGAYVEYVTDNEDEPRSISLPEDVAPAEVDLEYIEELMAIALRGDEPLGVHPDSGEPIFAKSGRFGPFIQVGLSGKDDERPTTVRLPDEMELSAVTLESALEIISRFGPSAPLGTDPESGKPVYVREGKYGPFIQLGDAGGRGKTKTKSKTKTKPMRVTLPKGVEVDDVDFDRALALIAQAKKGEEPLGSHPESGLPIYAREGRFGPFVQLGDAAGPKKKPKRVSLPPGIKLDAVDFDVALKLLTLPRALGTHPDDNKPIKAGIGRRGPYVSHGKNFGSLEDGDSILDIELPRALELLEKAIAEKAEGPGVMRDLGPHPEDGNAIMVLEGRFGPYIKHGRTNASLSGGVTLESLTVEKAVELLAAKASKKKSSSRR